MHAELDGDCARGQQQQQQQQWPEDCSGCLVFSVLWSRPRGSPVSFLSTNAGDDFIVRLLPEHDWKTRFR